MPEGKQSTGRMTTFRVNGGTPLCGSVSAAGNKNAVLPMIAAALLTDEPVVLENVPNIRDVTTMLEIAAAVGVDVARDEKERTVRLHAARIGTSDIPGQLSRAIRAGVLFAAPLVFRAGRAVMDPPGGDVIGRRRLDAHSVGLRELGIEVDMHDRFAFTSPNGLHEGDVFLPEASVTATEHLLLAAAVVPGRTVVQNAACEPNVQDLARMLTRMGAQVTGIGTSRLLVTGNPRLKGVQHRVSSDFAEAGSFLAIGAASGGEVTVTNIEPEEYRMIAHVYRRLGIELETGDRTVSVSAEQKRTVEPDPRGGIPVVDDGPWPQFPSDLMSVSILLATQLAGIVLFFEKMYESRMYFVDRLVAMGANAVICDPHRVVVSGPASLHAIRLSSPDIRAGIALLGAALCARGESTIHGVDLIDRGYERIETKLQGLGADIERIEQ